MVWKNPWYDATKAHHTPDGFRNPEKSARRAGDLQRWRKARRAQGLPLPPAAGYPAFIRQWWTKADLAGEEDKIWWLGHACILLRLQQRYCLIDPALSARASPVPYLGPKRKTPAPLRIADLPALEMVLISHNHYDHLDKSTIRAILRRFPDVTFVVPLGLQPWFRRQGARHIIQLDWWQSTQQHDVTVYAVPARHWSMRTLYDRNRSLWCGWVVKTSSLRFWFSGDSGYSENLAAIGQRLGPVNLAALPIGAWSPQWFMREQHMDPEQAVLLHQQLGCPVTLPIHWGVFELADESLDEPPRELARAMAAQGIDEKRFFPWKIGEGRALKQLTQD